VPEDQFSILIREITKLSEQMHENKLDILDRMAKEFKELPCPKNMERLKGVENGLAGIEKQRTIKLDQSARNLTISRLVIAFLSFLLVALGGLFAFFSIITQ